MASSTADGVQGTKGNASLRAEPGGGGPIRVVFALPTPDEAGPRDEVEQTAAAIVAAHDAEARSAIEAFARGAKWNATDEIVWDKGLLHGDC